MIRVPFPKEPPEKIGPEPWMTFAEAIEWIMYRRVVDHSRDRIIWADDWDDREYEAYHRAREELRYKLAGAALVAFGEKDGRHVESKAVEWSTREVHSLEHAWINQGVERFRVCRVDVLKLWPQPEIKGKPGRRRKYLYADSSPIIEREYERARADPKFNRTWLIQAALAQLQAGRAAVDAPSESTVRDHVARWLKEKNINCRAS